MDIPCAPLKTIKLFTATLILATSYSALSEPYKSDEGFDKIKTNVENSKLNKTEYDKNLHTVNTNITEINKAKTAVSNQIETVRSEIVQNNE